MLKSLIIKILYVLVISMVSISFCVAETVDKTKSICPNPESPEDWIIMGDWAFNQDFKGHLNYAESAYNVALILDPANAEGWFKLGNVRFELGQYEGEQGAITAYDFALGLEPENDDFMDAKAKALEKTGTEDPTNEIPCCEDLSLGAGYRKNICGCPVSDKEYDEWENSLSTKNVGRL